jgi:hypothetical protein
VIDVDKLERQIAAADGDLVAMSKGVLAELIADLRSGQQARRKLAKALA